MGFPSPAQDYVEERISLDERIISRSVTTLSFAHHGILVMSHYLCENELR